MMFGGKDSFIPLNDCMLQTSALCSANRGREGGEGGGGREGEGERELLAATSRPGDVVSCTRLNFKHVSHRVTSMTVVENRAP